MINTTELVLEKLQHMKKVNIRRTSFRVDSIALSLQMDVSEVMISLKELETDRLITIHLPTVKNSNHATYIGEVTLHD